MGNISILNRYFENGRVYSDQPTGGNTWNGYCHRCGGTVGVPATGGTGVVQAIGHWHIK